jgi:D-lyxose ketol-isomerase
MRQMIESEKHMKRSQINQIKEEAFIRQCKFALPPFAYWTLKQWRTKGCKCDEIRRAMLGGNITDYGLGQFLNLYSIA